jgi:hypothetical protein
VNAEKHLAREMSSSSVILRAQNNVMLEESWCVLLILFILSHLHSYHVDIYLMLPGIKL